MPWGWGGYVNDKPVPKVVGRPKRDRKKDKRRRSGR